MAAGTGTAVAETMSSSSRIDRRVFLGAAGVVALSACRKKESAGLAPGQHATPLEPLSKKSEPPLEGTVARRPLGKTGVEVSMLGLGGYHLGSVKDEAESARIIHAAIDRGVTFLDNCWDYHEGRSEEWMGKALADGHRQKAFLMTKLDGRTKKAAAEQLEQSLQRLRTDMIDLVQIHEVIRDTDPGRCFAEGGAIEALVEAKRAGKLRFIGFTGHKDPNIHLAMLAAADKHHFTFDTVQMPLNVLDAHYRSFEKLVLPVLVQKKIGVLGMKPMSAGKIPSTQEISGTECLQYAMSLPTSVVITGCESMRVFDQALQAAVTWKPMSDEQRTSLLERTKDLAKDGRLERFKTSRDHDGTSQHPEWLESASI
ncbi:MAG: Nucleoside-diphosphate-sugar epimerase [Labilithrix sp.]|nr:Nucleoside-diphosphate-sugar epimerase [Labilithrix sp.]